MGELQPEIVKDLKSKGLNVDSLIIAITDKKLAKYISHSKAVKGASIDTSRFAEVEAAIKNPLAVYEDIKTNEILYVYSYPYEENKLLKILIHPNFSVQGHSINLLKSIGVVDEQTFLNKNQFIKLK